MSKYIDAEKLIAEIERLIKVNKELKSSRFTEGIAAGYGDVLSAITSLQQEQPEIDLDEEIINYFQGLWPGIETPEQCNTDMHFTPSAIMRLARYFYELGYNARKEE